MRTGHGVGNMDLDSEMRRFYSGSPASGAPAGADAFTMETLKRELSQFQDPRAGAGSPVNG